MRFVRVRQGLDSVRLRGRDPCYHRSTKWPKCKNMKANVECSACYNDLVRVKHYGDEIWTLLDAPHVMTFRYSLRLLESFRAMMATAA